jgi:hypothetical protein
VFAIAKDKRIGDTSRHCKLGLGMSGERSGDEHQEKRRSAAENRGPGRKRSVSLCAIQEPENTI